MARVGDYGKRENKKPKKDARKMTAPSIDIIAPPVEVEVIKTKGKKIKEGEEE